MKKPSECDMVDLGEMRIYFHAESHYMEFHVVHPLYRVTVNDAASVEFQNAEAAASPTFEKDVDKAACLIRGSIKWDGCIDIDTTERVWHFCGLQDALTLNAAISAVYALAAHRIEAFSVDDAW